MSKKKKELTPSFPFHERHQKLEGVKMSTTKFKKPSLRSQMRKVKVKKQSPY